MKFFIAVAILVAAASAIPVSVTDDKNAEILRFDNTNIGVDGYQYGVETTNGIKLEEQAVLKNPGQENEAIEVRGQFSYPGPDGVLYAVTYVANELGFQPSAPHLPVSP